MLFSVTALIVLFSLCLKSNNFEIVHRSTLELPDGYGDPPIPLSPNDFLTKGFRPLVKPVILEILMSRKKEEL